MTPDMVNGLFNFLGGVLLARNSYLIVRHKEVRGVSMLPVVFFMFWGLWNLYYYPQLEQNWSFIGGIVIVSANTAWLLLAAYYAWKKRNRIKAEVAKMGKILSGIVPIHFKGKVIKGKINGKR